MSDEPGPDTDRDELDMSSAPEFDVSIPPPPPLPREAISGETMETDAEDTSRSHRKPGSPPEAERSETDKLLEAIMNLGKSFDAKLEKALEPILEGQAHQKNALLHMKDKLDEVEKRQGKLERRNHSPSWISWIALSIALLDLGAVGVTMYVAVSALKTLARIP